MHSPGKQRPAEFRLNADVVMILFWDIAKGPPCQILLLLCCFYFVVAELPALPSAGRGGRYRARWALPGFALLSNRCSMQYRLITRVHSHASVWDQSASSWPMNGSHTCMQDGPDISEAATYQAATSQDQVRHRLLKRCLLSCADAKADRET